MYLHTGISRWLKELTSCLKYTVTAFRWSLNTVTVRLHFSKFFTFSLSRTVLDLFISLLNPSYFIELRELILKSHLLTTKTTILPQLDSNSECYWVTSFSPSSTAVTLNPIILLKGSCFLQLLPHFLSPYRHPLTPPIPKDKSKNLFCLIFLHLLPHFSVLLHSRLFFPFNFLFRHDKFKSQKRHRYTTKKSPVALPQLPK